MGQPSPLDVSRYEYGALIRLAATFVSTDFVTPADPSSIVLFVQNAWGSVASYHYGIVGASITRVPTGAYYKDVTNDTPGGQIRYFWLGTGGVQAPGDWEFISKPTFIL
jgi:hypothetical protein